MIITKKWLQEKSACIEGIEWFSHSSQNDSIVVLKLLISEDRLLWANWLICRLMDKPNCIRYAIFAAECVLDIFEKKYPKDRRPRKAIEAAQAWLHNPNDKKKNAAYAAYDAADAAAYGAYVAADGAADAAAYAAYAADAAAYAAYVAADAAADAAAYAAYAAAYAARKKLQLKILKYGMKLLTELEKKS